MSLTKLTEILGHNIKKLEQIIAEASAFSEYDVHTNDAFVRIRDLAQRALDRLRKERDA